MFLQVITLILSCSVETVLIFLCFTALILATDLLPPISLTAVEPGDNVTLVCNVSGVEMKYFYWHKQPLGHMVQTVAKFIHGQSTISEEFKDSRFTVIKKSEMSAKSMKQHISVTLEQITLLNSVEEHSCL